MEQSLNEETQMKYKCAWVRHDQKALLYFGNNVNWATLSNRLTIIGIWKIQTMCLGLKLKIVKIFLFVIQITQIFCKLKRCFAGYPFKYTVTKTYHYKDKRNRPKP